VKESAWGGSLMHFGFNGQRHRPKVEERRNAAKRSEVRAREALHEPTSDVSGRRFRSGAPLQVNAQVLRMFTVKA